MQLRNAADDQFIEVTLVETANAGENAELTPFIPPYTFEVKSKNIASITELQNLANSIDGKISTEIAKVVDGADSSFDTFAKDAIKNNIKIGAYFFSSAITKQEAIEEADYVLDIIKPYKITYPVVIDFEEISGDSYRQENLTTEELTDIIIAFCDKIEKAGYKPMIYSNLKGFVGRLDLTRLEKYEKWFVYYSDTPYFPYEFSIWQYTESAKLDGVSGNTIDLNISFKDYN